MQPEIADITRNKWASILPAFGVAKSFLDGKQHPCPLCGGKDRFRFDNKDGRGTYYCNACGAGDGSRLLMQKNGWNFRQLAENVRPLVGDIPAGKPTRQISADDQSAACRTLLRASRRISTGDAAAHYLAARGLVGPYPQDLRFVTACPITGHDTRTMPAMVAVVRAPNGSGASLHRTYLGNGCKADVSSPRRMMAGTITKGSAIRLGQAAPVLGIAEGIETALAVTRDFGVPCWAASTAGMLADFAWPEATAKLLIFGDADEKYAGQAAAYRLAHRAATARHPLTVEVHLPPVIGEDWLDHGNRKATR